MSRRLITIAAVALSASACHFGAHAEDRDPGATVSRNYQVGAFDKIEVAGPYDVTVTTGGQPGVTGKGGEHLLAETDVVVEGDTLKIYPKKHHGFRWSWGHHGNASFTVTTAMLHGAGIAGSGGITVDKVDGDFKGDVAGSGDLKVQALNGGAVALSIAGSGGIIAQGKVQNAKIDIAGSGSVDAGGLAAQTAAVSIAGSGNVRANASQTANVSIMGSGDVNVTGGAKCSISKAGSGNVTCG